MMLDSNGGEDKYNFGGMEEDGGWGRSADGNSVDIEEDIEGRQEEGRREGEDAAPTARQSLATGYEEEELEEIEEATQSSFSASEDESDEAARLREQRAQEAFMGAFRKRFEGRGADISLTPHAQTSKALQTFQPHVITDLEELQDLRAQIRATMQDLRLATMMERYEEAATLRDKASELFRQDPIALRGVAAEQMAAQAEAEQYEEAAETKQMVAEIEGMATAFQLAGVWKAMYGNHGEELIKVHYEGARLVATKLTGDANVPAGQVTFKADLSPQGLLAPAEPPYSHSAEKIRAVFEKNLGAGNIEAFNGLGQVAMQGFKNARMVPGQLILFPHGIFGFLFLPLGSLLVFDKVDETMPPPPLMPPSGAGVSGFDQW